MKFPDNSLTMKNFKFHWHFPDAYEPCTSSFDVVPYILSGSIGYTCRRTHMQVENLLEVISTMRIYQLPSFWTVHELALGFRWHIKPHVAYKKLMLQGYFLARDTFHICNKSAHCSAEKDEVYLRGCIPTCMWWYGCHVSLEAGQMQGIL